MSFWDGVERTVKIAGILGGLAAVVGVYVQLRDINTKDFQRRVDDWQSAAVYEILEDAAFPLSLRDIAPRYAAKANNFPEGVPRSTLDEQHLRIALIHLMQSQAVVELANGAYTVKRAIDENAIFARTFKMMNDQTRLVAVHSQLAFQILTQMSEPLTSEQLGQRIIASGGDKTFVNENMPLLIETMVQQGELRVGRDGRLEASDGRGGPRHYVTSEIVPSPDILALLPRIDGNLLRYILTTDAGSTSGTCYFEHNPDIQELTAGV